MSGKEFELDIFKPLNNYFKILYGECGTFKTNCINEKLLHYITNKCDDSGSTDERKKGEVSDNFYKCLKLFALNLKLYDAPISHLTIKGTLHKLFEDSYDNDSSKIDIDKLEKAIEKNKICKSLNFKLSNTMMLDDETEVTYKEYLNDRIKADNVTELENEYSGEELKKQYIQTIFNMWMDNIYNSYDDNKEYFMENFLKKIWSHTRASDDKSFDSSKKIQEYQLKLLDKYFEIIPSGSSTKISLSKFIGKGGDDGDWGLIKESLKKSDVELAFNNPLLPSLNFTNYRINVKPNSSKSMAMIAETFPESVRNTFNTALLEFNKSEKFDIDSHEYKIKSKCKELNNDLLNGLLNYNKNYLTISKKYENESYMKDSEDKEEYSNSSDGLSGTFEEYAEFIDQNKNKWFMNDNGQLFKRNDKGKLVKYTKEDMELDAKKIRSGECGNLCIFEDPDECENFFEKIVKGSKYNYKQIADFVNGDDFFKNYTKLKDNIIHVNPIYVIGTLRLFNFKKWSKLNSDGTKTVKVESFTRWWNREGPKIMKEVDISTVKMHTNNSPMDPSDVPENLQLFLKLLVYYINNNEFVLNPQKDNMINKLKSTSLYPRLSDESLKKNDLIFRYKDGTEIRVPNGDKKNDDSDKENIKDLEVSIHEIRKNFNLSPASMKSSEHINLLDILSGIALGVSNSGRLNLLRKVQPYSTGYGYSNFHGGGGDDELLKIMSSADDNIEDLKKMSLVAPKQTKFAIDGYIYAYKFLNKHNKNIDTDFRKEYFKNIYELYKAEKTLIVKVNLLSNYVKALKYFNDSEVDSNVSSDKMSTAITDYENASKNVANKSDSSISLLLNTFGNMANSSYSDL